MHNKNLKGVQRWTYLVTQGENIPLYGKTKGVQEWKKNVDKERKCIDNIFENLDNKE